MSSKLSYIDSIDNSVISWIRDEQLSEIMRELLSTHEKYDDIIQERRDSPRISDRKSLDKAIDLDEQLYDTHEQINQINQRYTQRLEQLIQVDRRERYQAILEMSDLLTQANILFISVSNVKPKVLSVLHEQYMDLERKLDDWTSTIHEEYWKLGIFDIDLHRDNIDIMPIPISDISIATNLLDQIIHLLAQIERQWNHQRHDNPTPNRSANEVIIPLIQS